jgi:hypothetical protein
MRWVFIVVGVLLALVGAVWTLQGVGILLGSFMSGQPFWAAMGLLALICGATLVFVGMRRRAAGPRA